MINDFDKDRIITGKHDDPFSVLGCHKIGRATVIRTFAPNADRIEILTPKGRKAVASLNQIHGAGLFEGKVPAGRIKAGYRLKAHYGDTNHIYEDPYRYGPALGELDIHLLASGDHDHAYRALGAHLIHHQGAYGTRFAVWAPSAKFVSVCGDFNHWNTLQYAMRSRGSSGIWEIFIPGIQEGAHYKFSLWDAQGNQLPLKADPFGFGGQMRPDTASVVRDLTCYSWQDEAWIDNRFNRHTREAPISIYEVHLGSWQRGEDNRFLTYRELADRLIPYAQEMGFTHLELLPITEHPFDGSWGYQPIGLYAPTRRFGTPDDFKYFVDQCHSAGLGVILDWVPGHFPSDDHGLANFDGTHLYEHADPKKGFHPDWNTMIFNFGRKEVVNYLVSNARFWLEEYHLDGLRVDAVASMLYLDYSRKDGEWIPNSSGGNQNWEAVNMLRRMNEQAYSAMGGVFTVAEESTAWPGVSTPTDAGGLGFGFKWNMGWMNDSLEYMSEDPINRKHHHHKMTFGIDYAFSENYVLPLSHDEVVHGKGSILNRMPGDRWQKFANLRAYYAFMWTHPGKKLLFMGSEFAQEKEWQADHSLDWHLLENNNHSNIKNLVGDLNRLYRASPALYEKDCMADGFEWIDGGATNDNVLVFLRWDHAFKAPVLVVCNFSPAVRNGYRVGVPFAGFWEETVNTDSEYYGGSGVGNFGGLKSDAAHSHGKDQSLQLSLPPLATLIFSFKS